LIYINVDIWSDWQFVFIQLMSAGGVSCSKSTQVCRRNSRTGFGRRVANGAVGWKHRLAMTETDRQRFRAQLDEFSKRLDGRMRDFRERGRFTDIHRTLFEEIRQRHDQLERKLALATTTGTAWDVIRSGVERDFTVLLDALRKAGEQLDSDEMKAR
jgi:hypothetical protein